MYGLTLEEATPETEVWPDNSMPVNVFIALSTQWRVGMAGATGLDYNAVPSVMRLLGVPKKLRTSVFDDLRIMEDAALETMRKANK